MNTVTIEDVRKLTVPKPDSHKGQNGRLLIIGGSHLFHAASLWSLTVASRIVDLVHYCSIDENNEIVHELKKEFRNGIVVPRNDVDEYIKEDDVVLIGPGMVRADSSELSNIQLSNYPIIQDILSIKNEGIQTYVLTNYLLKKYPEKQWVIDAGALQMVDPTLIPRNAVLTPHVGEMEMVLSNFQFSIFNFQSNFNELNFKQRQEAVGEVAKKLHCIILLKGQIDIASNGEQTKGIEGGNAGMTKGGTGDVLAGLIAALSCKNDPWIATLAGSFINKKAGDELYKTVGPFFNATDLANQIPITLKKLIVREASM
jgi:NAD(P)H-hydrate epimerase